MASGTQVGALRYANVAFEVDGCQVIQPSSLAKPNVVANVKPPGELHFDSRLDAH
jgi:hypothetical protein